MIKADYIDASASLRLIDAVFLLSLAYNLQNPAANRKREPDVWRNVPNPADQYEARKNYWVHAANIIMQNYFSYLMEEIHMLISMENWRSPILIEKPAATLTLA